MIVFRFFIKWVLGIALCGFVWGMAVALNPWWSELIKDINIIILLSLLIVTNIIIWVSGRHRFDFLRVLKHEITHALFALLTGKKVYSLSATQLKGGVVKLNEGNVLIALSPYFLPIGTWVVIILGFLLNVHENLTFPVLAGILFGFHIWTVFEDFHADQPDIKESGFIYSLMLTISGNVLTLFFLSIIFSGPKLPLGEILSDSLSNSLQMYTYLAGQIKKVFLHATNGF